MYMHMYIHMYTNKVLIVAICCESYQISSMADTLNCI